MRKGLPKSDLQLPQKGLTAKTRRELRAQRKKQVAEAEQRELDLAVEHFFRGADTVNDHRAIVRDGWGVDHGYTRVSFSSRSRKSDLTIEQQQNIIVKKNKLLSELSLQEIMKFYKNLDKNVLKIFDVNNSMNSKKSYGGTSTTNVKAMIRKYKKEVK